MDPLRVRQPNPDTTLVVKNVLYNGPFRIKPVPIKRSRREESNGTYFIKNGILVEKLFVFKVVGDIPVLLYMNQDPTVPILSVGLLLSYLRAAAILSARFGEPITYLV